jgi:glycoprotein 3-alpha-L-fucosyltransferase
MLYVKDFPNIEALADRVKEIANNETLFRHYLRYKTQRPSDKFLSLYDISAAHSRCRMCIKMADLIDDEFGEFDHGDSGIRNIPNGVTIRVRERNRYYFQDIFIPSSQLTIEGMKSAIMDAFKAVNHQPVWRGIRPKILDTESYSIYRMYKFFPQITAWDTLKNDAILISNDSEVQSLHPNERIEVILV